MTGRAHQGAESGFSIVELIVAIVILAIGILAVSATMSATVWYMRVAHLETQLKARAQTAMEELMASPRDRLQSGELRDGKLMVAWRVGEDEPVEVLLVAHQRLGRHEVADTLATLISRR